jgi:hypothetical protein
VSQPADPLPVDPFIAELVGRLEADPQILGLVLAGSSAQTERRDRWSDHDFLVISVDGVPESYRTDLSWLPHHGDIAFAFRETAHGLKALYRSGLLVEFAVFDRSEFAACHLNHYSVAIDRDGIADLAADVRARSLAPADVDVVSSFRAFLCLVYIGTGRARRGERLSANVVIRDFATAALLRAVHALLTESERSGLDVLDPWRRVEAAVPGLAAEIDAALTLPVDRTGAALLEAADRFLAHRWPDYPAGDTALVLSLLTDTPSGSG